MKCNAITTGIATKASVEMMNPNNVASWSGRCEKDEIASKENRSIFGIVYFVVPAKRGSRL